MPDPREQAKKFIQRHPKAAKILVAAAVQAAQRKDPAALIYEGAAALADASKATTLLGMPIDELSGLLLDALKDIPEIILDEI